MADEGKLGFLVDLSISQADEKLQTLIQHFENLGTEAVLSGQKIDDVIKSTGASLNDSFLTKMEMFDKAIRDTENSISLLNKQISESTQEADKFLAAGDMSAWQNKINDITDAREKLAAETIKLEKLKSTQELLSKANGMSVGGSKNANLLFVKEEDYNLFKDYVEKVRELKEERAELEKSQPGVYTDELAKKDDEIVNLTDKINAMRDSARDAAAELGDSMGSRAVEATTRLYELNSAVEKQTTVVNDLADRYNKLAELYNKAQENQNPEAADRLAKRMAIVGEQYEEAANQLSNLKAQQKDANDEVESMSDKLRKVDGSFNSATSSLSLMTRAFTTSKNPIQIFRAALLALRGTMKLVELGTVGLKAAFISLWKTLLANPLVAILAAIAAVVAGIIALLNASKSAAEKVTDLYKALNAYGDAAKSVMSLRQANFDDTIEAMEQQLALLKAQKAPLKDIYALEDKINKKKEEHARKNEKIFDIMFGGADKLIEQNRRRIAYYEKEIARIKEIQIKEDDEDETVTTNIDGKQIEDDADKVIEALEEAKKLAETTIELAKPSVNASLKSKIDQANTKEERKQQQYKLKDDEIAAVRAAMDTEIALENDGYVQQVRAAKKANDEKIEDLKKRLVREKYLTSAAIAAINQQIVNEEKLKNQQLAKLAYDHEQEVLSLRRKVEDVLAPSGNLTEGQQMEALELTYSRLIEDVDNKLKNAKTLKLSKDEIKELTDLRAAYEQKLIKERKQLNDKFELERINKEKSALELRLASVQKGSEEEMFLRLAIIKQEMAAELAANKTAAEDRKQKDEDIISKYEKSTRDLLLSYDSDYQQWLSRLDALTVKELEKLLAAEKQALKELMTGLAGKDLTDEEQKQVDKLIAKITELENRIRSANLTPSQKDTEQWKKIISSVNDLGDAFKDLGGAIGGATGDVITSIGEITTTVGSTINAVVDGIKKVEETEVAAIKAMETATVVLAVITTAITVVQKIVDFFSGEDEGLKELEAATKKYEDTIHDLTRAFELLNNEIDKAYGSDRADLIRKQIDLKLQDIDAENELYRALKKRHDELLKEKRDYESRRAAWGSALAWIGGYWSDEDQEEFDELEKKLKESVENIEDLQREIKDLRQSMLDAIFGDDIQSAIERFADALTDAWEQGKDASESAKDFINNMIKDMLKQALLSTIENSDMMSTLRNMLAAWINTIDFGIKTTPSLMISSIREEGDNLIGRGLKNFVEPTLENIYAMGEQYADALSNSGLAEWYRRMTEELTGDREAQAKGIATASQESIDELNGRMTAVQGHTFNISENSNIIRDNIAAINGNVALIRDYTSNLVQMRSDMGEMKNDIQQIRQHGLQIQSA